MWLWSWHNRQLRRVACQCPYGLFFVTILVVIEKGSGHWVISPLRARRRDHITPVLQQLHWLPVRQRIVFKVTGIIHQSLAGVTPAYLADDCCLLSDARCPLWSDSNELQNLLIPRTHSKLGDRSFSVVLALKFGKPVTTSHLKADLIRTLQISSNLLKIHSQIKYCWSRWCNLKWGLCSVIRITMPFYRLIAVILPST